MHFKTAITIIIGLVFQFAQVLPGAVIQSTCQTQKKTCACCAAVQSCHCAQNPGSDQKPSPTPLHTSGDLKVPVAKQADTKVSVNSGHVAEPSVPPTSLPDAGPVFGFTGVRLSVAFCSFVI